jgi:hypothetical protein
MFNSQFYFIFSSIIAYSLIYQYYAICFNHMDNNLIFCSFKVHFMIQVVMFPNYSLKFHSIDVY